MTVRPAHVTRIEQLDSLRGLAALSVVFLHFQDMFFPFDRYGSMTRREMMGLQMASPFDQGHLAVILFFALSGFVLALGFLDGRSQPYGVYLARRVIRIYLPYLFALALAVLGAAIFHGHLGRGDWAEQMWSKPVSAGLVAQHLLFLGDYDFLQFNVVFWTLVYEMRISILFPLLIGVVKRMNLWSCLALGLGCSLLGRVLVDRFPAEAAASVTLDYMSVFLCGILLARYRGRVGAWYAGLHPVALGAFQACVVTAFFTGGHLRHLGSVVQLLCAIGLMVLTIFSPAWGRALNHRLPQYLGQISYSLYLVHAPILFTLIFLLPGDLSKWIVFPLYVGSALVGGSIFYAVVESPFVRLARRTGKRGRAAIAVPSGPGLHATPGDPLGGERTG